MRCWCSLFVVRRSSFIVFVRCFRLLFVLFVAWCVLRDVRITLLFVVCGLSVVVFCVCIMVCACLFFVACYALVASCYLL